MISEVITETLTVPPNVRVETHPAGFPLARVLLE
jgi:hypothetical protein